MATGDHPVRRGVLRDIDEMEKLMDNLFNFELAAYAGAHTPVSGGRSVSMACCARKCADVVSVSR